MRAGLVLLALCAVSCGDDSSSGPDAAPADAGPEPLFPASYTGSFSEVRDCRRSGDHDLHYIRVLVDSAAMGPYADRVTPFPEGAIVLKEEYDFSDDSCSGDIVEWTVMVKNSAATERFGWDWQRVNVDRAVVESNAGRCYGCHSECTPDNGIGYDYTCAEP